MLDLEEGGIPPPPYRTPKIPTLIKVKVKNGISLEIMRESFVIKQDETYNLKSGNHLAQRNIQTTQYGIESVLNFRAKLWNLLTRKIKRFLSSPFSKIKLENGSLKNAHASFVRHIWKMLVISDFSQTYVQNDFIILDTCRKIYIFWKIFVCDLFLITSMI